MEKIENYETENFQTFQIGLSNIVEEILKKNIKGYLIQIETQSKMINY